MKNPYIFGYLPFVTIVLFSLNFSVYFVSFTIQQFNEIGLYHAIVEFFSDFQVRILLLIVFTVLFFMIFAALKLIAETIHETALLFFAQSFDPKEYRQMKSGSLIYFSFAIGSVFFIQSLIGLVILFGIATFIYFIYIIFQTSRHLSVSHTILIIVFEVTVWLAILFIVAYAGLKLYNGILDSISMTLKEAEH